MRSLSSNFLALGLTVGVRSGSWDSDLRALCQPNHSCLEENKFLRPPPHNNGVVSSLWIKGGGEKGSVDCVTQSPCLGNGRRPLD